MDEVDFNTHDSNLMFFNGQAVVVENNPQQQTSNVANLGTDILQQAINSINSSNTPSLFSTKESSENFGCNGIYIVDDGQKDNSKGNLCQLSLQDAADLGLQFAPLDSLIKTGDLEPSATNLGETFVFQENDENAKSLETPTKNKSPTNSLSELLQFQPTPITKEQTEGFTFVPHYVDGQITYQLQMPETLPKEITTPTLSTSLPITCSNVSLGGTQIDFNSIKYTVCPVKTIQTPTRKVVTQSTKVSSSTGVTKISPQTKIALVNTKPRILNVRTHKACIDASKLKDKSMANGKSFFILNPRKIAPQKVDIPPLKRTINPTVTTDLKKVPILQTVSAIPKFSRVPTITTKPTITPTTNSNNVSPIIRKPEAGQSLLLSTPATKVKPVAVSNIADSLAGKIVPISNGSNPVRKLTQDQLKQIAAVLEKNKATSSTLIDNGPNARILCRIFYPDDFDPGSEKSKIKNLKRKNKKDKPAQQSQTEAASPSENEIKVKTELKPSYTRSGRLTRPPKHIATNYRKLFSDDEVAEYPYVEDTNENNENCPNLGLVLPLHQKREIDSKYRCPTCQKIYVSRMRRALHFEKYPDHYVERPDVDEKETVSEAIKREDLKKRSTNNGRKHLKGSLRRFPLRNISVKQIIETSPESDVVEAAGKIVANNLSAWDLILLRLESKLHEGKGKVSALLEELEGVVKAVQSVSQHILQRVTENNSDTIEIKDPTLSAMLGVSLGLYKPNDDGIKSNKNEEPVKLVSTEVVIDEPEIYPKRFKPNMEEPLKEEVDVKEDFVTDTSLLEDIYINQAELESVDQIVNERLETLAPGDDIIPSLPCLHGSDDDLMAGLLTSVVSPPTLPDSIFTPPVSDSTEDLYKTLENFAINIRPNAHAHLDFSELSNEFNYGGPGDSLSCKQIF